MILGRTGVELTGWMLAGCKLDAVEGELTAGQWQELREELRRERSVRHHTPATFYMSVKRGCPHGLDVGLTSAEDDRDFDPDEWLDRTGHAAEHFWDEDGDLYCRSLPSEEAGCEECETCPCMLPEERAQEAAEFWYIVSRERAQLAEHDAGTHHTRFNPRACALCALDIEAAREERERPRGS